MRTSLRKVATAFGLLAAGSVIYTAAAPAASAEDGVPSQWYLTQHDCIYAGNVYAQQGLIHQYTCHPENSGWVLTGWN